MFLFILSKGRAESRTCQFYLNHYFMCVRRKFTQTTLESTLAVVFFLIYSPGARENEQADSFRNIAMRHGDVVRLPASEHMYSRLMIMHHGIFVYARHVLVCPTHPHRLIKNRDLGYYKPGKGTKRGFGPSGLTTGPLLQLNTNLFRFLPN